MYNLDKKNKILSVFLVTLLIITTLFMGDPLAEGLPKYTFFYSIRTGLLILVLTSLFYPFLKASKLISIICNRNSRFFELSSVLVGFFVSTLFTVLFLVKPKYFNLLSEEDNIIEWGSFLFLFFSFAILLLSFFKYKDSNICTKITLLFLSVVFFVIAMEEVSWFQRQIEIETPEYLKALNEQDEFNFHNLATTFFENAYYFGAFVFLVVFPFLRFIFSFVEKNTYLNFFIGRPYLIFVGVISCAYNYDMWNVIFTQIAFFSSVFILFFFYVRSNNNLDKYISLFSIMLLIFSQLSFLGLGYNFDRIWTVTEYKEMFIPFGFMIYSLDILLFAKLPSKID